MSVVAIGSQTNDPDAGAPMDRQALLRAFALPPSGKPQAPRYQSASQNCLQLLLTIGTWDLQTSAMHSGETAEQHLKLHPTTSCHLPAMRGTGLILQTAGVDRDSLWDWLVPNRQCKRMFGSVALLHISEGAFRACKSSHHSWCILMQVPLVLPLEVSAETGEFIKKGE